MAYRLFISGIVFILSSLLCNHCIASHIVGGEVYYRCIGNSRYRIELSIYQDCLEGNDSAIAEDVPAFLGVYNLSNGVGSTTPLQPSSSTKVPPNFQNECVNNPPNTCLNKLTFVLEMTLQPDVAHRIIYMRCCRNGSIQNIRNPDITGVTYYADIPPANRVGCNSSAVFRNFPPQIICVNNPLVYDHSATDTDGDSLSYEFCNALDGGLAGSGNPRPENLTAQLSAPVVYISPYSAQRPITGSPGLQINPKTGLITGTPNLMGRYVVTVCCHEWRNGVRINTIKRDFQFNITNCSKAVVAKIPQFSDEPNTYVVKCDGYTVKFINESTGGFRYKWDFGVPGATSDAFEPEFTYPDTGTYVVKLTVNEGSTCPDFISRDVKIYPTYYAEFVTDEPRCPDAPVQFTDKSEATYPPVISWQWNFGDGVLSNEQNPRHIFANGGSFNVSLVSTSIKGCKDTAVKAIAVDNFYPFAGNDTVIVKGEYIDFNAQGGAAYIWSPADALNSATIPNPRGYFPDTGVYRFIVNIKSISGCEGQDSINVMVVPNPYLFMPSGFTPNKDGRNDLLRPLGAGYRDIRYFRVFNRWGQLVFQTNSFNEGWDGTFNGAPVELGAYFWVLGVTDRYGREQMLKGDVTLIR